MAALAVIPVAVVVAVGAAENVAIPSWACPVSGTTREVPANVASADAGPAQFNLARLHSGDATRAEDAEKPKDGGVAGVDATSLNAAVKDGPVLVVFYDPACPHCRNFVTEGGNEAPIEKLSDELEAESGPTVVKYNVAVNAPPKGYTINYVPMVFLIKHGESIPYEGGDLSGLKEFALQKSPELADVMPAFLHQRLADGH